jgi:hypothetical protein
VESARNGGWVGYIRTQADTVVAVNRRTSAGICMVTVAEEEEEAMKSILSSVQVVDDESKEDGDAQWKQLFLSTPTDIQTNPV